VNEQSYKFAATGSAEYPFVAPEGGKEPLQADFSSFTMGSDHDVYQDSSFRIPAIYLNDWPDRYIHTNFDTAANIDPTKLKRAAFIGAASGYYLANLAQGDRSPLPLSEQMTAAAMRRAANYLSRFTNLSNEEQLISARAQIDFNKQLGESYLKLVPVTKMIPGVAVSFFPADLPAPPPATGDGLLRFKRKPEPKGPLAVFGYDYFEDHAKAAGIATPKLLSYQGLWGGGEEYAYEVLNFADGNRNAQQVRDAVSAEYGPVPLDFVVEYLKALEKIGVVALGAIR
jgi:hypothetical protein